MSDKNIVFQCLECGWTNIRMEGEPRPEHKCEWDTKVSETADGILVEYNPRYPEDEMSNSDRFPCGDEIEEPTSTMSTTNDEQGYYSKGIDPDGIIAAEIQRRDSMDTPAERAPMLSDEDFMRIPPIPEKYKGADALQWALAHKDEMSGRDVIRFYESLITKGVLRVVNKVTATSVSDHPLWKQGWECDGCGCAFEYLNNFCPGCGAEIVKP